MRAGERLGAYEIVERIGAGGMGEVYKARDTRLGRPVAIKVLPAGTVGDSGRKVRLLQEARAASALNHPNIITIHDVVQEPGRDCIVMEYVAGKTLEQMIRRKGLRPAQALPVAVQIAAALEAAHSAGIIHRDLKPGNIMVTENGTAKVLDFGLAKLAEGAAAAAGDESAVTRTLEGTLAGTPAYMSPEQAEGKPADARSDIFSFGAVLYEMLTGERPFRGDTPLATLTAVVHEEPRPLLDLAPETPGELGRIAARCLRKDPARRFQHTGDLKLALEDLKQASDSGTLAPSLAAPPRSAAWPSIVTPLVVVGLAVAGVLLWQRHAAPPEAAALTPLPLTSYPGVQVAPSFSPDGNQVAFAWTKEGEAHSHIYIKLIGPGSPLQLTQGDADDFLPKWSPDGNSIAFLRSSGGSQISLVRIPALGGPERTLKQWTGGGRTLCWSPDGQWLVYSHPEAGGSASRLYGLSLASGVEHPLTNPPASVLGDWAAAISPGGQTLAFARATGGTNLYLLALGPDLEPRGEPRLLLANEQEIRSLAWAPDGREIVYSSGRMLNAGLWRIDASGGAPERLPGIDRGITPAFSRPRGHDKLSRMAYTHPVADANIWRLPMAGGKPAQPQRVIASTRREAEPHYSPDGSRIAFSSDRSGTVEVWIANADGSNAQQMTSFGALTTSAAWWSPDGRRLVFLSTVSGHQEIYVMDAGGGAPVRLTYSEAHNTAPSWSRDGKWIYFGSNRSGRFQVWKMPPEPKAAPVQVTRQGGYAPLESWDGKTLYYAMRNSEIRKMPVDGGAEEHVLPQLLGWGDFDLTPEGIVFIPAEPAPNRIQFYSFATGQIRTLLQLAVPAEFGLSVSAVDGSIVYTQVDRESSELMLVEGFR